MSATGNLPEMVTVWKLKNGVARPIAVRCKKPGYPNRDEDGETMYENSHYADEATAWAYLLECRASWVRSAASRVREARESLAKAEADLVEAAMLKDAAERAHEDR